MNKKLVDQLYKGLDKISKRRVDEAIDKIVQTKMKGGKIAVVTGSGPNIHEGVTTLIAELISKGIVDGVLTSSAVIAHEMAGTLDKVKRVDGKKLGIDEEILPRGFLFEVTIMDDEVLAQIKKEMVIDEELVDKVLKEKGRIIIKAAGNMGYPMGLRTERLAREAEHFAKSIGKPLEYTVGLGADKRTIIGAAAEKNVPILVTVPQLVGGGAVGLAIGDSISITERSARIANMLGEAEVVIESAVALTQEIHDGPFETYTGHGIWARWKGYETYKLENKTLIRIDMDPNLEKAWQQERASGRIQEAVDKGLPKTKLTGIPFRMEMSGFARLEDSIPIVEDIGVIWPIIAKKITERLGRELDFISYPQGTPEGKEIREWIVKNIKPINREEMVYNLRECSLENEGGLQCE
ncbi:MAG: deoxyhypusine synthase family protein [Candidatus Aerophobetes bacterium]|nr:deoxyhypusine synthase family protein [Candidatus Aerophobetes bacterium]